METADLRESKNIQHRAENAGKHYKSPQKIWFKRLGAGGPGFESPHSDQILQKNRLNRRFFCILSLIFVVLEIAVLRRFQWWNSGRGMSERSRRNRQIPNPSLTGELPHFLRFYRCRCRPLLIVCLRCVGREAGFLLL